MLASVPIRLRSLSPVLCCALIGLAVSGHPIHAQAPSTDAANSSGDQAGDAVVINSVGQAELSQHLNQQVRAVGIIGNYLGDRSHYRFSLDDGSSVMVVGTYPQMGGTHWTVDARVVQVESTYALSEISKTSDATTGKANNGLIIGTGVLAVLLIAAVAIAARSRANQQKAVWENRVQVERERAAAALALAEQARAMSNGKTKDSHPHPFTIVSVGSLQVIEGPHKDEKFAIQLGETRIGRLPGNNIAIVLDQDGEISGLHGIIEVTPDGVAYYNNVSRNGSIVDGVILRQDRDLIQSGSIIEMGSTKLQFTSKMITGNGGQMPAISISDAPTIAEDRPAQATDVSPAEAYAGVAASPKVSLRSAPTVAADIPELAPRKPVQGVLEVVDGVDAGLTYPLTQSVTTLGRENRDIIFSDEGISRRHASLFVVEGRHVFIDNDSTHGTFVNGKRIGSQGYTLMDGDLVAFGSGPTTLKYREG